MSATKKAKSILIDIAGGLLIIAAGLFGWIPGPGGIPLFLAGLGLLAINHDWAKRLLTTVKEHSDRLVEMFFPDHRAFKLVYDVLALLLLAGAVLIFTSYRHGFFISLGISLAALGLTIALCNRSRLKRLKHRFKR